MNNFTVIPNLVSIGTKVNPDFIFSISADYCIFTAIRFSRINGSLINPVNSWFSTNLVTSLLTHYFIVSQIPYYCVASIPPKNVSCPSPSIISFAQCSPKMLSLPLLTSIWSLPLPSFIMSVPASPAYNPQGHLRSYYHVLPLRFFDPLHLFPSLCLRYCRQSLF